MDGIINIIIQGILLAVIIFQQIQLHQKDKEIIGWIENCNRLVGYVVKKKEEEKNNERD